MDIDRLFLVLMSIGILIGAVHMRAEEGSVPLMFIAIAMYAFYVVVRFVADVPDLLNKRRINRL